MESNYRKKIKVYNNFYDLYFFKNRNCLYKDNTYSYHKIYKRYINFNIFGISIIKYKFNSWF